MGLYKNSQFIHSETKDSEKIGLFKENHCDILYAEKLIQKLQKIHLRNLFLIQHFRRRKVNLSRQTDRCSSDETARNFQTK